jgi:4a-hydroxytetrahydrobiopterin dehydratase
MKPESEKAVEERRALAALQCQAGAKRLPPKALAANLACLTGWTKIADRIEKTFRFDDYHQTIAFVNALAAIAHREDHHPDLSVHYNRCTVVWSTHDAGGVTLNDCICAAKVEDIAAA